MANVIADMSMSLDGFIATRDDDVDRLHRWLYDLAGWRAPHGIERGEESPDSEVVAEAFEGVGAAVMGRRTVFTFVNDGIEDAVHRAAEAAGERDVSVSGGASVVQQCIRAGLLHELQVHIVPVLLGDGSRLFEDFARGPFELEPLRVLASPAVTHVKYAFR